MTRQQDVLDARAAADNWALGHGLPPSGIYSGDWYVDGYLGGWLPEGWLKWWAAYGIEPGSIIGGDIVAHQYGSTPVDLDVMLESELTINGGQVDDVERKQYQDKIDGLVSTIGLLVGDDMKGLLRKNAAQYVKDYVNVARARADAVGIQHV